MGLTLVAMFERNDLQRVPQKGQSQLRASPGQKPGGVTAKSVSRICSVMKRTSTWSALETVLGMHRQILF